MKVSPALHGHPDTGCLAYRGHTILYICQQREGEGGIRAVQNIWYFDGNFVFVFDTKFSKRQCWCKGNSLEGTPGWLSINYLDCPLVVRSHKSIATSCSYLSSGKLQINFSQCWTLLLQIFQIWFYNLISASSIFIIILPTILYIRCSIFNIMIKYLF